MHIEKISLKITQQSCPKWLGYGGERIRKGSVIIENNWLYKYGYLTNFCSGETFEKFETSLVFSFPFYCLCKFHFRRSVRVSSGPLLLLNFRRSPLSHPGQSDPASDLKTDKRKLVLKFESVPQTPFLSIGRYRSTLACLLYILMLNRHSYTRPSDEEYIFSTL